MLTVEMVMGILVRGTKNLNITVIPYINDTNSIPKLFTPKLTSGLITEPQCMGALNDFQNETLSMFNEIIANTDAGYTIQALKAIPCKGG